ncbi:MAG: hypothetical protein QUS33_01865 [Dehalococcoidia bacterium]|nr:hypothetical protein [Dehalococcoidia bacterium]
MTTTPGDYGCPVFDSGPDTIRLLQLTLDTGILGGNTTYYWQVRHRGSGDLWSDWSQETSFTTQNRPPYQPSCVCPENGATGVALSPTLQSSAFSDPDAGDSHAASQWQVTVTSGDYGNPIFDSGVDSFSLRQVTVPAGRLSGNTTYYWHVRHQDNHGLWSAWSQEFSFTVQNRPPDRPIAISPEDGASGIALNPTLCSSAFSDPDVGDTHAATQWQVTATPGDYADPVWLSLEVTSALTQITVPGGLLNGNTAYCWRVRYQDNQGDWSEWSEESRFTTLNRPPDQPAAVSPASGATDIGPSVILESSAFSDPDVGDMHAASQWQVTTNAGDYGNPIFDNAHETGSSLTSIVVTACSLSPGTTYYWRVRYRDNHGAWSDWSQESSFSTQSAPPDTPPVSTENHPPDRPVCIAPENGARNVSTAPTLESSAFHDLDAGDSQAASQWQITTISGDYRQPVVDRLESLNSAIFADERLSPGTTYFWRVRYQDNHGAWSEWSEESSFTTAAQPAAGDTGGINRASWLYLAAVVAVAVLAVAAVLWRNARATAMATR